MNMGDLMKQAQQFQEKMSSMQGELGSKTVSGTAGGGMVNATVNGNSELVELTIEPSLVNPGDVKMLEDLVQAAVNDGLRKAKEMAKSEMGKLTGGMNIPGLF